MLDCNLLKSCEIDEFVHFFMSAFFNVRVLGFDIGENRKGGHEKTRTYFFLFPLSEVVLSVEVNNSLLQILKQLA